MIITQYHSAKQGIDANLVIASITTSLRSFETAPPHDHDDKDPKEPVNPSHDHNKGPDQSVNTVHTSPVENKESPTNTSPATFSSVSIQHLNENKYKSTLLKTAISPIEHNGSLTAVHILFDEGSHRSFITNNLARSVGLTVDHQETLSLSTFGGSTSSVRRVEVGTINLQTPNGEGIPTEVIVPEIVGPLQDFATIEVHSLPHLKGLTFAHPITDEHTFEINLLVGADHWDVVEDEVIKGHGPIAVKSKIGYLLSGPNPTVKETSTLNTTTLHARMGSAEDMFEFQRFWELNRVKTAIP